MAQRSQLGNQLTVQGRSVAATNLGRSSSLRVGAATSAIPARPTARRTPEATTTGAIATDVQTAIVRARDAAAHAGDLASRDRFAEARARLAEARARVAQIGAATNARAEDAARIRNFLARAPAAAGLNGRNSNAVPGVERNGSVRILPTATRPRPNPLYAHIQPKVSTRATASSSEAELPKLDRSVPCTACAKLFSPILATKLESCGHAYCNPCLRIYVLRSKEPQIPCPMNCVEACGGFLSDPEIKEVMSEQFFQKYLSRSLETALKADDSLAHCFAPGCPGICLIEDGLRYFYCPSCAMLNCTECKATHERPCKRPRRRPDLEGAIGLVSDDEEGDIRIAMKIAPQETEQEATIRLAWEAGWEELRSKMNEPAPTVGDNGLGDHFDDEAGAFGGGLFLTGGAMGISKDLVTSGQVFECSICFTDAGVGEGVILQECFHRFCRGCLSATVEHSEEPRVKCPFQSGTYSCQMYLLDREAKSLVTEDVYEKLLKKSLSAAEMTMSNAFHCKSVNCNGWVEVEAGVTKFNCLICSKENCVPCKAIHEAVSCANYQSRLRGADAEEASKEALNTIIANGEAMRCPTCKIVIIKDGGCDGMQCVVCRTHICWATKGPRWGPMGVGDSTGGCRCMLNGKRCHPSCKFCH